MLDQNVLDAVTFLRGYWALNFWREGRDTLNMTVIAEPTLRVAGSEFTPRDHGFRDTLCECIDAQVKAARLVPNVMAEIVFSNGCVLSVPLDEASRAKVPESLWLRVGSDLEII